MQCGFICFCITFGRKRHPAANAFDFFGDFKSDARSLGDSDEGFGE